MPLRTRIFIMVGAGIFVVAVISGFLIFSRKKTNSNQPQAQKTVIDQNNFDTAVKVGIEPTVVPKNAKVLPPTPVQQEDITVKNIARVFVERYYTYSSENNYQNIKDIQNIVTALYWKKISAPLSSKIAPTKFVSLTTEVVSVISVDVKKDSAVVTLKTRKTSTANGNTTSGYGEYIIILDKINGSWLVSGETAK